MSVEWTTVSVGKGFGSGRDQNGNFFTFTFGMSETEARELITREQARSAPKPELPAYRPQEVRKEKGFATGTGFYITSSGYMLTNFHVIDGASKITIVHTKTGTQVIATVVQVDRVNDVALLKVGEPAKSLALAYSKSPSKGDDVLTLGYPLVAIQGQEQKATFGRINSLTGIQGDVTYLQTDTPIQPGNSGGPLLNARGEVIGIMTKTLNQLNTLRVAGALPQNVNYALKIDSVRSLLSVAGIQITQTGSETIIPIRTMAEIVQSCEDAVALVISE